MRPLPLAALALLVAAPFNQGRAQNPAPGPDIQPGHFAPTTSFALNTASEPAREAFETGYSAMLELDWTRAANEMRRAYALDPDFALARAVELSLLGRSPVLADTIDALWRGYSGANLVESMMLMSLRERHLGRAPPANIILNAAAHTVPSDWRLAAELGLWLGRANQTRLGIARTIRDGMPDHYIGHAYTALAAPAMSDSAEAMTGMREALRLGADRPFAHYAAGELLTQLRRHDEAIAHYEHALALDPQYHQALRGRAGALLYAERFDELRRDLGALAEAATYAPTQALARRTTAFTYIHERDIERAIREMESVVGQFESEGRWRTQLALAHRALAMWAAAQKDVGEVQRRLAAAAEYRDEDYGPYHLFSVYAWSLAEQPERARAALDVVEALNASGEYNAGPVNLGNARGWVALAEGRPTEALEHIGTSTNHFSLLIGYQALTALGRQSEARARLEQLFDANGFALDSVALGIARYLYGGTVL